MKAIVCGAYGPPEVLELKEVETPTPKDNEILIRVRASTVTAGDVRIRSYTYAPWFWLPGRFMFGLTKPRKSIPGDELAGQIESVGKDVTLFREGDLVFGMTWAFGFGGTNAEYICLPEDGMVAIKPATVPDEQAAALPFAGLTALHFLRKADIQSGQRVLINGASGGVGTYAVQLARYFGAEVTGVCSGANMELVKSLGADQVIDYTKEDFAENGQAYDVIFDTVIKTSFSHCKGSLEPGGVYLTADWPLLEALWASLTGSLPGRQPGKRVILGMADKRPEALSFLVDLVQAGELRPVIDRRYTLAEIVEAHRYVETGRKKGNVIVTVEQANETRADQ